MCNKCSVTGSFGMIIAAIFASFFVASMIYGYYTQVYGSFWLAILWYFLGFILLIIAKCAICVTKAPSNEVPASRSRRRRRRR